MDADITFHLLDAGNAQLMAGAEVFDGPLRPASLAAFIEDPLHHLFFARQETRVIGFTSGVVLYHPDKPPMMLISEVGVEEPQRRQGVAKALVARLIDHARALGCEGIWLATEGDNRAAQALYASLGARRTDDILVYDWDGAMDDPTA
ncbi:GNAT family N-acetyltransferase [Maritimibacter sp. DP1N21-5]|uniref:GNAT family N-acetyltransferase n=1 Tax=Maritimibacter sp. DP1N21-5 TaxID=2836867 RepID=UPI001C45005F|nr:GNAT family N-acetyltransferase [Maritimibacter sp. DP1N21-5]MBV7409607.1 GNAT family N-acetyltransferase [Maritimibacter sp. DP1N21-5]